MASETRIESSRKEQVDENHNVRSPPKQNIIIKIKIINYFDTKLESGDNTMSCRLERSEGEAEVEVEVRSHKQVDQIKGRLVRSADKLLPIDKLQYFHMVLCRRRGVLLKTTEATAPLCPMSERSSFTGSSFEPDILLPLRTRKIK